MVTINEPHVTVTDVEKIKSKSYGDAGKTALIGAFPNSTFQIDSFTTLEAAQAKVGAESIPEGCISYGCLEYIFRDTESSCPNQRWRISRGLGFECTVCVRPLHRSIRCILVWHQVGSCQP